MTITAEKIKKSVYGFIGIVLLALLLWGLSGCATDFKLTGPSCSVRSGFGGQPAALIAGQPPNEHRSNISSASAATMDPGSD